MMKEEPMESAFAHALIAVGIALASPTAGAQANLPERACPYDYRLITDQECRVYRTKVLRAKSADDRHAVHEELERTMEKRAKERGIAVDDWRGLDVPVGVGRTR